MILIGNCRHGSEVAVYTGSQAGRPFLRKAASTPDGILDLHHEWSGWQWYAIRSSYLKGLPNATRMERPSYVRIDFPFIPGTKGFYQEGILRNSERIRAAIDHYMDIWPKEKNGPMHGDFSVDNLLFNDDRVVIVDWEHFSLENTPWGFDALHLIFETLWYDVQAGHALPSIQKQISAWMNQLSHPELLSDEWRTAPLAHLMDWMTSHSDRWGTQVIRFPNKFPVLRFSPNQIKTIDAWF